jgi:Na+/H+-dicarboxylate symporter
MLVKLENLGCEESVFGLVIPTGYSFNLDGTCLYLTTAAVFLAQATNTPLALGQQLGLIGVLLLTSKGAAGVTGAAFIVLAATLSSVGTIPVASIALVLGIHRFMSEALVPTNLIGNAVATIVVSKWEGRSVKLRCGASWQVRAKLRLKSPKKSWPDNSTGVICNRIDPWAPRLMVSASGTHLAAKDPI